MKIVAVASPTILLHRAALANCVLLAALACCACLLDFFPILCVFLLTVLYVCVFYMSSYSFSVNALAVN